MASLLSRFKLVENLWSLLIKKIDPGGRQYTSKVELWNVVLAAAKDKIESLIS